MIFFVSIHHIRFVVCSFLVAKCDKDTLRHCTLGIDSHFFLGVSMLIFNIS